MIAFALLLVADPAINYSSDAVRLEKLLADIGKQTGQTLRCSANIAAEPIIIDVHDVPFSVLKTKLADFIGGSWKDNELTLSSEDLLRQQRADQKRIEDDLNAEIEEAAKAAANFPAFDDAEAKRLMGNERINQLPEADMYAEVNYLSKSNPAARFAVKLLKKIGAQTLAQIGISERVVYSDKPTRMQRAIPITALEDVAQLQKDAALMSAVAKQMKYEHSYYGGLPGVGQGDAERPNKLLFALTRRSPAIIRYTLVLAAEDGTTILDCENALPSDWTANSPNLGKGTRLQITDDLDSLAKLQSEVGVAAAGGGSRKASDGTMISFGTYTLQSELDGVTQDRGFEKILSDPVENDPIGLVCGELIRQWAKNKNCQLLATIPDDSVFQFCSLFKWRRIRTDNDVQLYFSDPTVGHSGAPYCDVASDNEWLIMKPRYYSWVRSSRFDRAAARNMIQSVKSKGTATVDDGVLFCTKTNYSSSGFGLAKLSISHANPSVDRIQVETVLRSPVNFFAALGQSRWKNVVGQSLRLGSLPPEAKAIVVRWVFSASGMRKSSQDWYSYERVTPATSDPTEIFADGIPESCIVNVSVVQRPAMIAKTNTRHVIGMSVFDYAEFSSRSSYKLNERGDVRTIESVMPVTQNWYTITVSLPGDYVVERTMTEMVPAPGAAFVALDQIPNELKKAIESAKKDLGIGG